MRVPKTGAAEETARCICKNRNRLQRKLFQKKSQEQSGED